MAAVQGMVFDRKFLMRILAFTFSLLGFERFLLISLYPSFPLSLDRPHEPLSHISIEPTFISLHLFFALPLLSSCVSLLLRNLFASPLCFNVRHYHLIVRFPSLLWTSDLVHPHPPCHPIAVNYFLIFLASSDMLCHGLPYI